MKSTVYIQRTTALNQAPSDIVVPLVGRVHAIAVLQSISAGPSDEAKYKALIDVANAAGLEALWWFCPGAYSFGRDDWVLEGGAANKKDWLDFQQLEVRQHVASVAAEMMSRMPYAGVNLDYIRWAWWVLQNVPTASAEDITETVRLVRAAIPDKVLTAAVVKPAVHPYYGVPTYELRGQMWPDWLEEGLLDCAQPMSYAVLDVLREWLDLMPDDSRISPIISAGPTANLGELTPEQFGQLAELVRSRGRSASVWDWQRCSLRHWEELGYLEGGDTVGDISEDLRATIAGMGLTVDAHDVAIAEMQARQAVLRAQLGELVAIADRLDVVDQKAEDVAAEI